MVKASRRSLVLASALVGLSHRPLRSLAQEEGTETETQDDLFACVSMLARDQVMSDEDHDRVAALAEALGTRRAELFGQPYSPQDLVYAYSFLCWWPFKPEPEPEYRAFLEATLPRILESELTPTEIAGQLPDEALTLSFGGLFQGLEGGSLLPLIEPAFEGI